MSDSDAAEQWVTDRTTFQRVYDVLVGTRSFLSANEFAERAACSDAGARQALEQLTEMGIGERQEGRPVTYRRNDSYVRWKRIETLVTEHTAEELQARVDDLLEEDAAFQERFGVPSPEAVVTDDLPADEHEALHEHWAALNDWRTVRRDIRLLRQAVQRADEHVGGTVQA